MKDREKEIEYLLYLKSELIKQTRKEIERLNNIIDELEKYLLELRLTDVSGKTIVYRLLDKLKKLKGESNESKT